MTCDRELRPAAAQMVTESAALVSLNQKFLIIIIDIRATNISVVRNCGITTNENNTYFESDGSETGACTLRVCKVRKGTLMK